MPGSMADAIGPGFHMPCLFMRLSWRGRRSPARCSPGGDTLTIISRCVLFLCLLTPLPATAQVSVRTAPLADVLVDLERRAPAQVVPLNDSVLAAEVNAVVRELGADTGQAVRAGDLLVRLDETDFQLQLQAAEAALASARARREDASAKLDRARRLVDERYVSEDELLSRQTALSVSEADIRNAEAQASIARRNLEKCRVLAPFDGVVRERSAQLGAYATVGAPLLRLTQTGAVEVDAEVPDALAGGLEESVDIVFHAQGEQRALSLLRLSPVIDTERRARRARFAFSGDPAPAGRSGEVTWRVASGQLPASLLSRRDGQLGVFLARDGRAVFVPVPGAQEGRPSPVDLPGTSAVIVQGQDRLQDGDAINLR